MNETTNNRYRVALAEECHKMARSGRILSLDAGQQKVRFDAHQRQALEAVGDLLDAGRTKLSVVHAGGGGKTVLESALLCASQVAKKRIGKSATGSQDVAIAIERSLVTNMRKHFDQIDLPYGVLGMGQKPETPVNVLLATVQAMHYAAGTESEDELCPPSNVSLVIGDEADKLMTQARAELIRSFANAIRIGFTATPKRHDGVHIRELWGETADHFPLKEAMQRRICVPISYVLLEAAIDADALPRNRGDYERKGLAQAMQAIEIEKNVALVYRRVVPRGAEREFPTLVYVPSVAIVEAVTAELKTNLLTRGLCIENWIGDELSTAKLEQEIQAFDRGEIDILVLCEMGGRGLNLPRARYLMDLFPSESLNKIEQRHSRISRKIRTGSDLEREGFRKPFAVVAQVIPRSTKLRPATLLDVLDTWEGYEPGGLVGVSKGRNRRRSRESGRVSAKEIRALIARLREGKKISSTIRVLEEVDILAELQRRDAIPKLNEEGWLTHKKKKFAPLNFWAIAFGVTHGTVESRIVRSKVASIQAKDSHGVVRDCYAEDEIRSTCNDLMTDFEVDPATGIVEIDSEPYAPAKYLEHHLGLKRTAINARINKAKKEITARQAKVQDKVRTVYPLSEVGFLCADLLDLPVIDSGTGFAVIDGQRYANIYVWPKYLRSRGSFVFSAIGIATRLEKAGIKPLYARGYKGKRNEVYSERDVVRVCSK